MPAKVANAFVDVAIVPCRQGTVQTASGEGTNIFDIALLPEQNLNLEQIARRGAGMRVSNPIWNEKSVSDGVQMLFSEDSFKDATIFTARRNARFQKQNHILSKHTTCITEMLSHTATNEVKEALGNVRL